MIKRKDSERLIMKMSKELAEQFELDEKMQILKNIQGDLDYQAQALNAAALSQAALKKLAVYTGNIKKVKVIGDAIAKVGERADGFHDTIRTEEVSHGFHFASLGIAAFNFFRIPMMYLAAYLLNQKVPFNMSNNARWGYSAALLALTITAIAVPVAAPIIGFVLAGAGLAASTFFLGKILYERSKLAREERSLQRHINAAEDELALIKDEAKHLEHHLNEATSEQEVIDISLEIALLKERHSANQKSLEGLYDKKLQNQQLREKLGIKNVVLKSVSLILASTAVIGLAVSLFFPPVGLGILAGVAVAGATLVLGQVLVPLFQKLGRWISNKMNPTPKPEELKDDKEEDHALLNEHSLSHEETLEHQKNEIKELDEEDKIEDTPVFHDSTSDVLLSLTEVEHLVVPTHAQEEISEPPAVLSKKLFSPPSSLSASHPSPAPHPSSSVPQSDEEDEEEGEGEHLGNH
jgi:hypothetical protein